jgi:hypothetical protein
VNLAWRRGEIISTLPGGPAAMIQSDFRGGGHGNFELITVEGTSLVHYWHDNSDVNLPWRRGQTVTTPASGIAGLLQSDFRSGGHGNFEVVVFDAGHVFHHWHDNGDVSNPWRPGQIVTPSGRSQKVCQLTGDIDFQNRHETTNLSKSRYAVAGTDLGYPFEHDGRLYFLFGDTHGRSGPPAGPDSIAFTRSSGPIPCPELEFVADGGTFRPIQATGVSLDFFEVPTTGFSANGAMYVFVWTDHKDLFQQDPQGHELFSNPVGHAALLRSDNHGRDYRLIWDHLGDKLVYLAAAVVNNSDIPGLPGRSAQGLLIWGSGKFYRASDPYLAYLPLNQVEMKDAVRYFTGINPTTGQAQWGKEPDAKPLFQHPCLGELSVTWNRNLRQWLMLYNCDNPNGVVGRLSDSPWGPWSDPAVLFDGATDAGSCYFIRGSGECGPPSDPESPANGGPGGVYAPYVIARYTQGGQGVTTIYYIMSTWNPYQVVLMQSTLALRSSLAFGPDTCKPGFAWREAIPDDHVCVTPITRDATQQENRLAARNRSRDGGPFGPDTCLPGFVWRDAYPGDHVCVNPSIRDQASRDNAQAASRRVQP